MQKLGNPYLALVAPKASEFAKLSEGIWTSAPKANAFAKLLEGIWTSCCISATLSAVVSLKSVDQNLMQSSTDLHSCLTANAHLTKNVCDNDCRMRRLDQGHLHFKL